MIDEFERRLLGASKAHRKYQRRGNRATMAFGNAAVDRATYAVTGFVEDHADALMSRFPERIDGDRRDFLWSAGIPDGNLRAAWFGSACVAVEFLPDAHRRVSQVPSRDDLEAQIERCSQDFRRAIDDSKTSRRNRAKKLPRKVKKHYRRMLQHSFDANLFGLVQAAVAATVPEDRPELAQSAIAAFHSPSLLRRPWPDGS